MFRLAFPNTVVGFSRMPGLILCSSSACRREKSPIIHLRARHVHGDPEGFVPVRLATLDRHCDGP